MSINGAAVRTWPDLRTFFRGLAVGDSATFVVQRPTGRFEIHVLVQGFDRPVVRIEPIAAPTERQRILLGAWMAGR